MILFCKITSAMARAPSSPILLADKLGRGVRKRRREGEERDLLDTGDDIILK
jgi:hypothetical protein